jgi:hypothetical protein
MKNKYIAIGASLVVAGILYFLMKDKKWFGKGSGSDETLRSDGRSKIVATNATLHVPAHTRDGSSTPTAAKTYNVSDKVMKKVLEKNGALDFPGSGANGGYGSWVTYFGFDSSIPQKDINKPWYPAGSGWYHYPSGSLLSISYSTADGGSNYTSRGQYDKIEIPMEETLTADGYGN